MTEIRPASIGDPQAPVSDTKAIGASPEHVMTPEELAEFKARVAVMRLTRSGTQRREKLLARWEIAKVALENTRRIQRLESLLIRALNATDDGDLRTDIKTELKDRFEFWHDKHPISTSQQMTTDV